MVEGVAGLAWVVSVGVLAWFLGSVLVMSLRPRRVGRWSR